MTFYEAKGVPYGLNALRNEFYEFSKNNLMNLRKDEEEVVV